MTIIDIPTGVFLVATGLFSALTALFLVGKFSAPEITLPGFRPDQVPEEPHASTPYAGNESGLSDIQRQELLDLQDVVHHSPMLVWRVNEDKQVVWANRAYHDILDRTTKTDRTQSDPLPVLFDLSVEGRSSSRQQVRFADQDHPSWFEQFSAPLDTSMTLHFALRADPIVKAEDALRNFVQTLTKTFAHLPIGLAIFDRDRQLALFNPALADLTTLEPEWLTARPTLYAFLDRLREYRHVPEPKDYKSWRDRIAALEQAAVNGTYEENWPLPTGQTYRVTGRPHPKGAVAFLFEDISSSISLQRQFRSELELSQSLLDSMPDAIAVFSGDGDLVMSNDAFAALWGVDPREMLASLSVNETVSMWQAACKPSLVWEGFRDFAGSLRERAEWDAMVEHISGQRLCARFTPLSRGAISCSFSHAPSPVPQSAIETTIDA